MSRASELLERVSSIVYHATGMDALLSILADNNFRLTAVRGPDVKVPRPSGKDYYLSVARSKQNGFRTSQAVCLVLDGDKFNSRYSGKAVDYYGVLKSMGQAHDYDRSANQSETEDRVFSKDPVIPNASSYILEIHVWRNYGMKDVQNVFDRAKGRGIPFYFYKDKNAFDSLSKSSALTGTALQQHLDDVRSKGRFGGWEL